MPPVTTRHVIFEQQIQSYKLEATSNESLIYQVSSPMGKDNIEYYLLTPDYVGVTDFDGETILKVKPEALTLLAQ